MGSLTQTGNDKFFNTGTMRWNVADGTIIRKEIEAFNFKKASTAYNHQNLTDKEDEFFMESDKYEWDENTKKWEYKTTYSHNSENYFSPPSYEGVLRASDWTFSKEDEEVEKENE